MEKIRLGIIGYGNMGTGHAKNILEGKCPEIELAAVADINPARLQAAKEELPETTVLFGDAEKMMDSGLIDAVHIAIPHYDHPKYAVMGLQKGLHVMVEKPAGVYTKQVRLMNAEAEKHPELTFGMMFNQRTNCLYRKMKELVEDGTVGEIKRVNWIITDWYRTQSYYDSGAWRATWSGEGGGVLLNQCPHQLDLFQWICGLPVKVDAHLHFGKWHDIEVEDDVTAYVEFANGATGSFITTTGDAPGTNRFEVTGTKGTLVCEDNKLILKKLGVDEREWCRTEKRGFAPPPVTVSEVETDGKNEQHSGVLNAFAAHILRGEPLVAGGEEGIRGLTLSNAMHLSSFLGRPVEIPFDEDLYYDELMKRVAGSRRKTHIVENVERQ
ncbi:MAG: Gfo/Idh/MocA family oxidoreductase [Lachnospiraceae bacterium]|nr:Gfo/Idh/MocA family oxidoreductase [Lachnospiraceae bacterium]